MNFVESDESEKLQKLIENKKQFLRKQTNEAAAKHLQREIMFLEKDILPIVQSESTILFYECGKYFNRCMDAAMKFKCNGALIYVPIHEMYNEQPEIAVFNARELDPIGTHGAVSIEIINMDIAGNLVKPVNLLLNALV